MSVEVLESGKLSLPELADKANREHALVLEAGQAFVEHAIRAGDALLAAEEQCEGRQWTKWLEQNFSASPATGRLYMRVAQYQDRIRDAGIDGLADARAYLTKIDAPTRRNGPRSVYPDWMREEALRLDREGMSLNAIAKELGVSWAPVRRWIRPDQYRKDQQRLRARRRRDREAALRSEEQRRTMEIKQAVKKAGAATAEAYSLVSKLDGVLGQAREEAGSKEKRLAINEAHRLRDRMIEQLIVALGVA